MRRLFMAGAALVFGLLTQVARGEPPATDGEADAPHTSRKIGAARAQGQAATAELAVARAGAQAVERAAEGVVNVNDASEDELSRLPGVGPAKARAIAEHRKAHPFRKVEDLTKVKGIGRKTFARLKPYVTLSGATTLKSEAHPNK